MSSKRKLGKQKFCPLTAEVAKDWYQKNYLSTAGYLLAIKEILRPPGVDLKITNVSQFCEEWDISRSAFYRGISTITTNNDGTWETLGTIVLKTDSITGEDCPTSGTGVPRAGQVSHERDTESHEWDTESHQRDTKSHQRDTESSKAAQDKDCEAFQTYTDFIQTLSDREREKFLNFVKKEVQKLPQPINDLEAWLANKNKAEKNRWEIYYQNFLTALQETETETEPKRTVESKVAAVRRQFQEELERRRAAAEKAWEEEQQQGQSNHGQEISETMKTQTKNLETIPEEKNVSESILEKLAEVLPGEIQPQPQKYDLVPIVGSDKQN